METNDTPTNPLDGLITDLEAVRGFLAEHPDLPEVSNVTSSTVMLWLHRYDDRWDGKDQAQRDEQCRAEFARCARILMGGAPIGSIKKEAFDYAQSVTRSFGAIKLTLNASREAVCERLVIGTEKVQVPDPDAPMVEVEREIVAWECTPILPDDRTKAGAHYAGINAALEDERAVSA